MEENRGITLFENDGFSKDLEVYSTSSAGRELQVTVVALSELYSAKIGENAIFLKSESDFNNFMQNDKLNVAIFYNLPYKSYLQLSKKEDKSLVIINNFDYFTNSEIFDDVISKLGDKKFYCYTKTRLKSRVERPFMYFE